MTAKKPRPKRSWYSSVSLVGGYSGPLMRVRLPDGSERDVYSAADLEGVGEHVELLCHYDQSGNGAHARRRGLSTDHVTTETKGNKR